MTTFVLSKYSPENDTTIKSEPTTANSQDSQTQQNQSEPTNPKLMVSVTGTIAEIVAKALNKVFAKDEVQIQEVSDGEEPDEKENDIKSVAISSESIGKDPFTLLNTIRKDEAVFIASEGFKTLEERWFIVNIPNKTSNVFLSVDKFANHIRSQFLSL